ncbi:DEAD-box ATP-dependent RNA helicase 25 [Smittium mucronatum]|uniref:ATP-dependent RNA helicase n=1 Tax=Smittium mucronatum TaxID=133383 RepID=A0A1R0H605_9FUNG|nr:DEAD-box ATP-dependent RNA helicase 25 [Smittium mucronatum]
MQRLIFSRTLIRSFSINSNPRCIPLFKSSINNQASQSSIRGLFASKYSTSSILSNFNTSQFSGESGGVVYNNIDLNNKDEYSPVPFSSYSSVDKDTLKSIKNQFGFENASKVQDSIISRLPSNDDFLIKAKTGTGKTIAFLVSAIETLLKEGASKTNPREKSVGLLIVSPTRELAKQIAMEAKKLSYYHRFAVHLLVGGESGREQNRGLSQNPHDIVVGTPGRLLDIWENNPSFSASASKTKVLIFDEADMLLDLGFQNEVNSIIQKCPEDRQTFLVSATFSSKVRSVAAQAFGNKKFTTLDCVDPNDSNVVHKVKQSYVLADWDLHFPTIFHILKHHIKKINEKEGGNGSKIVIFLPTTKSTQIYSDVIKNIISSRGSIIGGSSSRNKKYGKNNYSKRSDSIEVFCLHGKKSQDARSRISDRFRQFDTSDNNSAILITTDVSARGVDYPGTRLVLQVGIPKTSEQYTHRVGRTGRAGTDGEGIILLSPSEIPFIRELEKNQGLTTLTQSTDFPPQVIEEIAQAISTLNPKDGETKSDIIDNPMMGEMKEYNKLFSFTKNNTDVVEVEDMFVSLLGFYQSCEGILRFDGQSFAKELAKSMEPFDITEIPHIPSALRQMFSQPRKSSFRSQGNFRSGSNNRGGYNNRGSSSRNSYSFDDSRSNRGGSYNDGPKYNRSENSGYDDKSRFNRSEGSGYGDKPRFNRSEGSGYGDKPKYNKYNDKNSFNKSSSYGSSRSNDRNKYSKPSYKSGGDRESSFSED